MVEVSKKDKIKKKVDRYVHTSIIEYPIKNVENFTKAWKESIDKYDEWLGDYDNKVEEARKMALVTYEEGIKNIENEVEKILGMSDEERLKYWNEIFLNQVKDLEKSKEEKDKIILQLEKQNLDLLEKYKKQYEMELKNKKQALKLWSKAK